MSILSPTHALSLQGVLQAGGVLVDGVVPTLNASEGKVFAQVLANHIKEGDLIDGLEAMNNRFRENDARYRPEAFDFYGPWQPEGMKDVNATLRSLAMHRDRWDGNKEASLLHPLGNRSNPAIQAAELYLGGRNIIDILSESLPWELVLPRLEVESFVVDLYLDRPDWLTCLCPDLDPSERSIHFADLARQNDRLKKALEVLAGYFRRS